MKVFIHAIVNLEAKTMAMSNFMERTPCDVTWESMARENQGQLSEVQGPTAEVGPR